MKVKCFLTVILLTLVMSVSAQVQVFTHNEGHGAICREKNLFMMEQGDRTAIWNIVNYKKSGSKETFTLNPKEDTRVTYSCVMTLNGETPTEVTMTNKSEGKKTYKLKLTNDETLHNWYGGLCGYEKSSLGSTSGTTGVKSLKEGTAEAGKKVGEAAKSAFNKVKGLFGKKKKDKDKD